MLVRCGGKPHPGTQHLRFHVKDFEDATLTKYKIYIKMEFIVAEKNSTHGLLLVITDEDIVGRKFEEGKRQLDMTAKFYLGEKKTKEEVKKLIPKARHLHLTGKHIIAVAIEFDLVHVQKILWVNKVPHAQVVCGE